MKIFLITFLILGLPLSAFSLSFDDYLTAFSYKERKDMKISTKELLELYSKNDVQIIDIRFKEEFKLWHLAGSINIPLNELPKRLGELDKTKLIVTVCPHLDRAAMGRHYLKLKGYNVKYLKDGLINLFENSRGDRARDIFVKKGI